MKKKGNSFWSFFFALVAIGAAVAAFCAYIKSKKAAQEIREDFLSDLGYDFDDGTYYGDDEEDYENEADADFASEDNE